MDGFSVNLWVFHAGSCFFKDLSFKKWSLFFRLAGIMRSIHKFWTIFFNIGRVNSKTYHKLIECQKYHHYEASNQACIPDKPGTSLHLARWNASDQDCVQSHEQQRTTNWFLVQRGQWRFLLHQNGVDHQMARMHAPEHHLLHQKGNRTCFLLKFLREFLGQNYGWINTIEAPWIKLFHVWFNDKDFSSESSQMSRLRNELSGRSDLVSTAKHCLLYFVL